MGAKGRRLPLIRVLEHTFPDVHPKELYSAVLCGEIRVDGEKIRDPKTRISDSMSLERCTQKYVGRGGYKLEGALDSLGIDPQGLICLDAGASTGGFTHCLLSRGALKVHAVDVGYNQLAWKLRKDPRVVVHERTNLMNLVLGDLDPPSDMAVADLSFRSLRGAASKLLELTAGGAVLVLVKPQFENPEEEAFDGVVRSRQTRAAVLESLMADLCLEGAYPVDATASAIRGRKGNVEIFLLLADSPPKNPDYFRRRVEAALA